MGSAASRSWPSLAVMVWLAGAVWGLIRLLRARRRYLASIRPRHPVQEPGLPRILERVRAAAGMRRPVRVTWSGALSSPVALGRGEICLPRRALTDLSPAQQEAMLAHELAHLARRDPVWLLAVGLMESLFFFQPLHRLARRRLQENSEYLCDEWAVRYTGRRRSLARCLARVATWIEARPQVAPVASMARLGSPLIRRIQRLLDTAPGRGRELPGRWRAALAVTPLLLIGAVAPGVTARGTGSAAPAATPGPVPAADPGSWTLVVDAPAAPAARPATEPRPAPIPSPALWGARIPEAAPVVAGAEAPEDEPRTVWNSGERGMSWEWSADGERFSVSSHGRVELDEAAGEVGSISPGGFLALEEDREDTRRFLRITPNRQGGLDHEYRVDGRSHPYDPEGRRFLREGLERLHQHRHLQREMAGAQREIRTQAMEVHRRAYDEALERRAQERRRMLEAHEADRERLAEHLQAEMERLQERMERLQEQLHELHQQQMERRQDLMERQHEEMQRLQEELERDRSRREEETVEPEGPYARATRTPAQRSVVGG